MNLQNFKDTYVKTITESANDSDLKNYIRSIVEETVNEFNIFKTDIDKRRENDNRLKQGIADLEKIRLAASDDLDKMLTYISTIATKVEELSGNLDDAPGVINTVIKSLNNQVNKLKNYNT